VHAVLAGHQAGEQAGARGRADGVVGQAAGEQHPFGGEPVGVRGLYVRVAVAAERPGAVVVGQDQHDVGARGLGPRQARAGQHHAQNRPAHGPAQAIAHGSPSGGKMRAHGSSSLHVVAEAGMGRWPKGLTRPVRRLGDWVPRYPPDVRGSSVWTGCSGTSPVRRSIMRGGASRADWSESRRMRITRKQVSEDSTRSPAEAGSRPCPSPAPHQLKLVATRESAEADLRAPDRFARPMPTCTRRADLPD